MFNTILWNLLKIIISWTNLFLFTPRSAQQIFNIMYTFCILPKTLNIYQASIHFSENVFLEGNLLTSYKRKKAILKHFAPKYPKKVFPKGEDINSNHEILVHNIREVITDRILNSPVPFDDSYPIACTPSYARKLKEKFHSEVVTGYFDSPAHARLLETVPCDQRPPVLLAIYADGLDRDGMVHSSGKNKLHCTYVKVINTFQFGRRSKMLIFVLFLCFKNEFIIIAGPEMTTVWLWLLMSWQSKNLVTTVVILSYFLKSVTWFNGECL